MDFGLSFLISVSAEATLQITQLLREEEFIYIYDCSNCVQVKRLNNNIFHRNYAYFSGGAVHADFVNSKFSVRMPAVFRLTNTSFKNNLAGRIGGALASL